jgi:hypothetical protein
MFAHVTDYSQSPFAKFICVLFLVSNGFFVQDVKLLFVLQFQALFPSYSTLQSLPSIYNAHTALSELIFLSCKCTYKLTDSLDVKFIMVPFADIIIVYMNNSIETTKPGPPACVMGIRKTTNHIALLQIHTEVLKLNCLAQS